MRARPGHLGPLLVRTTAVGGAVLVVAAAPAPMPALLAVFAAAVAVALTSPARFGAAPALAAGVAVFVLGAPHDVGRADTLLAAAGLYTLHTATALAAACPWGARLSGAVARRWLLRCLPAVVLTAAAAGLDASLGRLPATPVLAVVAAVLAVGAALALIRVLAAARPGG